MAFSFQKQLELGKAGEETFQTKFSDINAQPSKDKKYDFTSDIGLIELKTDFYPMKKTPNFFFERWGTEEMKKPGGPWRAKEDKVDYFVYFFFRDGEYFWFDPVELSDHLDTIVGNYKEKRILNKGWRSIGYAIPRDEVKHLLKKI